MYHAAPRWGHCLIVDVMPFQSILGVSTCHVGSGCTELDGIAVVGEVGHGRPLSVEALNG